VLESKPTDYARSLNVLSTSRPGQPFYTCVRISGSSTSRPLTCYQASFHTRPFHSMKSLSILAEVVTIHQNSYLATSDLVIPAPSPATVHVKHSSMRSSRGICATLQIILVNQGAGEAQLEGQGHCYCSNVQHESVLHDQNQLVSHNKTTAFLMATSKERYTSTSIS
jgi:hypothetical protein